MFNVQILSSLSEARIMTMSSAMRMLQHVGMGKLIMPIGELCVVETCHNGIKSRVCILTARALIFVRAIHHDVSACLVLSLHYNMIALSFCFRFCVCDHASVRMIICEGYG